MKVKKLTDLQKIILLFILCLVLWGGIAYKNRKAIHKAFTGAFIEMPQRCLTDN